jgi:hypothetical protein
MLCIIFARGKSKVTDMQCMFEGCKNFNQQIYFDVSNVIDTCDMFSDCDLLEEKNIHLMMYE